MGDYNKDWMGADRGHEGFWEPSVLTSVLKFVADNGGSIVVSDTSSSFYSALATAHPSVGWVSNDNGHPRSFFRDAREPWVFTNTLSFDSATASLTEMGKALVKGDIQLGDVILDGCIKYREPTTDENPFSILSFCLLQSTPGTWFTLADAAKIMRHFRPATEDSLSSVISGEEVVLSGISTRRLKHILTLLQYAGIVLKAKDRFTLAGAELARRLANSAYGKADAQTPAKDILGIALKYFSKSRDKIRADIWPSFDDWVKDARQAFASIDEHQIVAPTFDYNHFVKFVFSSRQRTAFSKFDASQKGIVGKFLREERTNPHSVSWYLDPVNKVPVEGIGAGIMFYFMMMVRPDEFATWSGMMDEGLFILGLRNAPSSDDLTVANYEKTKSLQQIVMQKMHEMRIGKATDDSSSADYLTVNEFLWFVTANEKDIKEQIMKQQLKKPTGAKNPGAKKLSDVLSSKADDLMNRLVAALLTKPFAILAGASGTGKSRMAKKLAYMTCLDKDLQPSVDANGKCKPLENFIIVPVKPNWHDSSDLLGYRSSIKEKGYQTTPFINFIIKAHCFPETPFIACLDEMNLAPVEHYFAEYLSASEGSIEDAESGKSVSYPLIEPALFDADVTNLQLDGYALPAETKELIERVGLVIPKNLFVVGTVNMDDSTDQISRKVLDRAMTIEMNEVNYSSLQDGNYEKLDLSGLLLGADDIAKFSKREAYDPAKLDNAFREMLDSIKGVFDETPFALGYRFGIESTLYREALKKLPLKDDSGADVQYDKVAIDHMALMKVLPRITGTLDERADLLSKLKAYFRDSLDDKGLSKIALARMEKAAKSNGGYLGFWP